MNEHKTRDNHLHSNHHRRYSHYVENHTMAKFNAMLITCCIMGAGMWYGIYLILCEI